MQNKKTQDTLTIGFALFAMFFGAGNLLLPPYIGIQIGDQVLITILAFGLTGILLPFLGILSVVKVGDRFEDLGNRFHPLLAPVLGMVIMLCIGPLIGIPRTAATTYEVGVLPFFPESNPLWTSILFFAITWGLTIRPRRVVDIIGNVLTPLLLVLLLTLVVTGILMPIDSFQNISLPSEQAFTIGFIEGYQTLDVLASVIFAGIIIAAARTHGYKDPRSKVQVVVRAGALSSGFLFLIYGGLIYLGATSGISDPVIKRSELLMHIARSVLGPFGNFGIAISIALACLTTSIALVSAFGTFFSSLSKGKLPYKLLVSLCCLASAVLSVTGVDSIISFAYPILSFVYPIAITLILYSVVFGSLVTNRNPYLAAILASALIALCYLLRNLSLLSSGILEALNHIPLFQYELGWVFPSAICFLLSWAFTGSTPKQQRKRE